MNLRNKKEPKKRGRPPTRYSLTVKGFIYAHLLSHPDITGDELYDELEAWAKKKVIEGEIPALVFDDAGGIIVGVQKKNES